MTRPSPTRTKRSDSIPKNSLAYFNRGRAWAEQGDFDKAMADFNEASPPRSEEFRGVHPAAAEPG